MRHSLLHIQRSALGVALSFLCSVLLADAARAQEPFPGLDAYIKMALATWKLPGLSVAIVRNDSVLFIKGYGVLTAGTTTPVDEQTLFEIGSTSKAMTATLVAMLVSDGKMRYDDLVTAYLPDFRLYDPIASAELTIRDALSHRSGIGRGELVWLGRGISREEVLHRMRFLKPESPFRSRYSYQNMMFLVAGEAAGKAAGSTWDELVKQRIFTPLGMTSTVTTLRELANKNVATPHGMERDSVYVKPHWNIENMAPAGAINSSARDMAQWLRFQISDGVSNGKRLVGSAALHETHTPQILTGGEGAIGAADSLTFFSAYGLGWWLQDYRHQLLWWHEGGTDGMSTMVGILPEHKFGLVILSNMRSAPLPRELMRYILDRQLNAPHRDWSAEMYARSLAQRRRTDSLQNVQASARPPGAQPRLPLTAYAGTYADSLYGEMTITLEQGRLEMRRGEWHGPLEYWNADNFRWTMLPSTPFPPMFIKFDVTPENKVRGMHFGFPGDSGYLGRKAAGSGARGTR